MATSAIDTFPYPPGADQLSPRLETIRGGSSTQRADGPADLTDSSAGFGLLSCRKIVASSRSFIRSDVLHARCPAFTKNETLLY